MLHYTECKFVNNFWGLELRSFRSKKKKYGSVGVSRDEAPYAETSSI